LPDPFLPFFLATQPDSRGLAARPALSANAPPAARPRPAGGPSPVGGCDHKKKEEVGKADSSVMLKGAG